MPLPSAPQLQTQYREVMDLPDWQVRRARLEALDQEVIDHLWQGGLLKARPTVKVYFEEGTPQGHPRDGARAESPGLIAMRSDSVGRVADGHGCAATGPTDPAEDVVHRWAVLLHEAAHFTFDQLPATAFKKALSATDLSPRTMDGMAQHLWAPFLNSPERKRLNETFADAYSSAFLLAWAGDLARAEVDRLIATRQLGRESAERRWLHDQPDEAFQRLHVGDHALRQIAASSWDSLRGATFVQDVLNQAVQGTAERWRAQPEFGVAAIEDSWLHLDLSRARMAALHAKRHHDPRLLDQWIQAHSDHPVIAVAQRLRWNAPEQLSPQTSAWMNRWEPEILPHLDEIAQAWEEVRPTLQADLSAPPRLRRRHQFGS